VEINIALITILVFGSFLLFMFLGLPVVFSLFGVAIVFSLITQGTSSLPLIFYNTFGAMTFDIFLAIPLFIIMSTIIQYSGIAAALYDTMYKWFGPLRGGLAIGTVVICTLIAAMTGLGATGTLTMGIIALPQMLKRGYDKSLAVGCIPPGGALGPIIPPSAPMVTVAAFASLSVGKMFIGGIIPGLMLSFLYCVYIAVKCHLNPQLGPVLPPEERATWREKFISLRGVILTIILVIAILGGIYTGAATPTEAGGLGAFGALICAAVYRQLNWKNMKEAVMLAAKLSGMVMWVMAGGMYFSSILSIIGVSQLVTGGLLGLPIAPIMVIALMQVIVLILGMLMDGASITVICIPLFMPVVVSLGFDPLWFCIVFTINLVIGYITPPFGMNLFYMKGVVPKDIKMDLIYRAVMPYVVIDLIVLALCFAFPEMVLWLPNLMQK
jgi:tripartite ATP-independent transporter DctM subunit